MTAARCDWVARRPRSDDPGERAMINGHEESEEDLR
jgi:hypothetical protein